MIGPLVSQIADLMPAVIFHSDLVRTRAIALPLASKLGIAAIAEPLWRERDFGTWEGRHWHAIYRQTGNAMDGMIDAPHTFRPGGGETTAEFAKRIEQAMAALPDVQSIAIVAHGGSIACVRAQHGGVPLNQLAELIPPAGSYTIL